MTFGSRLRAARKEKKLTQKELASKIQAAHNSISNWENDQNMPDPDTIQNLCWALDVQPNYFFSVDTPSPSPLVVQAQPNCDFSVMEIDLIHKFRCLDDRGQSAVLNVLEHEYNSLLGEKANPAPKEA